MLFRSKKVALAYDVDPAGQSAGTFGVTELNALISEVQADGGLGLTDVGVVRLPDGKDPDEVIRETPDLWREATRTPDPILTYLIDFHASRVDIRAPDGRKRLVDGVLPTLRRVADPIVRDSYLQILARRSGVEERTLLEVLHQRPAGNRAGADGDHGGMRLTLEAVRAAQESVSPEVVVRSITPVEAELLRLLLLVPEQQERVAQLLQPDGLPSTVARELYRGLLGSRDLPVGDGPRPFERGRFLDALDSETRALAIALYARPGPDPSHLPSERIAYAIDKCLLTLEGDRLEEAIAYNLAEQADAERRGDHDAMGRLLDQERQYNEARRSLDRRGEQTSLLARPMEVRT